MARTWSRVSPTFCATAAADRRYVPWNAKSKSSPTIWPSNPSASTTVYLRMEVDQPPPARSPVDVIQRWSKTPQTRHRNQNEAANRHPRDHSKPPLTLEVINSGQLSAPPKARADRLSNARERLRLLYGTHATLRWKIATLHCCRHGSIPA